MKSFLRKHKVEAGIFLAIVAVRVLAFLFLLQVEPGLKFPFPLIEVDSREYYQIGLNLKESGIFSLDSNPPLEPDSFRTPVYPFLISLFLFLPGGVYSLVLFQSILSGFIGALAYRLGLKFFSKTAGLFAAVIFALEPSAVFYSNMAMTETIFLLFLLSALWFFLNSEGNFKSAIFSGVLLGLAAMTRPIGIFLPVLFAALPVLFFKNLSFGKRAAFALILVALSAAVVFPWVLRNKLEFNSWSPSSVSSFNLYYYNAMRFYMNRSGASFEDAKKIFDANIREKYGEAAAENSLRNADIFKKEALAVILKEPARYVMFHLGTLAPFFLTDGLREMAQITKMVPREFMGLRDLFLAGDFRGFLSALKSGGSLSAMFVAGSLFFLIITLLMLAGFVRAAFDGNRRFAAVVIFSSIIILALLSGVVTTARFRYAVSPLIFILSGYGFEWLVAQLRKQNVGFAFYSS